MNRRMTDLPHGAVILPPRGSQTRWLIDSAIACYGDRRERTSQRDNARNIRSDGNTLRHPAYHLELPAAGNAAGGSPFDVEWEVSPVNERASRPVVPNLWAGRPCHFQP